MAGVWQLSQSGHQALTFWRKREAIILSALRRGLWQLQCIECHAIYFHWVRSHWTPLGGCWSSLLFNSSHSHRTNSAHHRGKEQHSHRSNEKSESEATALPNLKTASVSAHITGRDPDGINLHNPVGDMKWKTFKEGRKQINKQINKKMKKNSSCFLLLNSLLWLLFHFGHRLVTPLILFSTAFNSLFKTKQNNSKCC